jgi:hypothetical protein
MLGVGYIANDAQDGRGRVPDERGSDEDGMLIGYVGALEDVHYRELYWVSRASGEHGMHGGNDAFHTLIASRDVQRQLEFLHMPPLHPHVFRLHLGILHDHLYIYGNMLPL